MPNLIKWFWRSLLEGIFSPLKNFLSHSQCRAILDKFKCYVHIAFEWDWTYCITYEYAGPEEKRHADRQQTHYQGRCYYIIAFRNMIDKEPRQCWEPAEGGGAPRGRGVISRALSQKFPPWLMIFSGLRFSTKPVSSSTYVHQARRLLAVILRPN